MKHITKNEFIISTYFAPIDENAKEGQECEHQEKVSDVHFYHSEYMENKFTKISLTKNQILELAEKIKEIESNTKIIIYESMPF